MPIILPCLFPCGGPSWGEYDSLINSGAPTDRSHLVGMVCGTSSRGGLVQPRGGPQGADLIGREWFFEIGVIPLKSQRKKWGRGLLARGQSYI